MSVAEWVVVVAGLGLILFELWFFLGGKPSIRRAGE